MIGPGAFDGWETVERFDLAELYGKCWFAAANCWALK